MKIQNKVARYINNVNATNTSVQLNKMVKAIALAERELEQARQMLAEFEAQPVQEEVVIPLTLDVSVKEEATPLVLDLPVAEEKEVAPLVLNLPAEEAPKARVVDKVKQNLPPKASVKPQTAFLAGPAKPGIILNSARVSHKNGSMEYLEKLRVFMYSGILKLAEAGVRELHVAELDGVEFLMPFIWDSVLAKFPDMKLVLFSNGKNDFEKYKSDDYEKSFGIHSPYRLQQQLRTIASRVIMVQGNAFAVRRAVAKDTNGYVRISPFKMEDATTPLYQGKSLCVQICPWTLAVAVGGGLERLSKPGDGNDYRPLHIKKQAGVNTAAPAPTH